MLEKMSCKNGGGAVNLDYSQKKLRSQLEKYREKIEKEKGTAFLSIIKRAVSGSQKHRGLYIHGDVGRGKTMLLQGFFDSLKTNKKLFVHFHKFMNEFHEKLNSMNNSNNKSKDYIDKITSEIAEKYSVIVLDELQVNNISDAMIVGRLFQNLIEKKVFIFFSSNRPPCDLFKDGLQRERFIPFIDYINDKLDVFELNNFQDYRLKALEKISDSYFSPINKENEKKFRDLFDKITGGHEMTELDIFVDTNRTIKALNTYGNVAFFTFKELCEVPLGAKDYLALCHNFKTIAIKNIPVMNPDNHNEALRFITLIDCMYNSGATLLCTAAAEPADLYVSGKNSFEFKRTASRLNQMRAFEYRHMVLES